MAFGSRGCGSVPFGSTFTPVAIAPSVSYVEYLGGDLVRVWFTEDIIINSDYFDITNYVISDANANTLPVIRVVRSNAVSLPYVLLRTKPQTAGQEYNITVLNIQDRTGIPINSAANIGSWVYNRTKGDSIISSMPSMYDTSAGSNIRAILQAIANEQNLLGGSPSGPDEDE